MFVCIDLCIQRNESETNQRGNGTRSPKKNDKYDLKKIFLGDILMVRVV